MGCACDCNAYSISIQNVFDAIAGMKQGKCADDCGLSAEHFQNGPVLLFQRLQNLFSGMLKHGFVPKQFRFGFMIPIIKDSQGNASDVSNYRGITISPIISKIFEHILKSTFCDHLSTSVHQYGFKKRSSTSHALFCLKETISYFINNGSKVHCSFLDASKAFHRLVHSGLFIKLMEKKVPKIFLDIIMTWHDGLFCRVKWDNCFSSWFNISAGVRQGGVLSPDLYCLYVDDLLRILHSLNIGCYVKGLFAAALFYADDMAVLAPSVKGLQLLLDACAEYCLEWDIMLNSKKSKNMVFGTRINPTFCVRLGNEELPWEPSCKYLGVTLKSGPTFGCCVKETIAKFYKALNTILRIDGRSDDMVMLRLLEAHCLPILSYGVEVLHVTDRDDRRHMSRLQRHLSEDVRLQLS